MNPLVRTVLATIAYYDAMDYPLTLFEVWRYLSFEDVNAPAQYRVAQSMHAILMMLDALVRDGRLLCVDGFYVLPGRVNLVKERRKRVVISVQKLRMMRRSVRYLRWVPFLRMIFVTGRLAMKHAQNSSDWDVLIVLKKGHIWTGRFLITAITQIFGWRRTDAHHADHLCLNYFITTQSMSISLDDRFSAHEYMMARPIFASINPEKFLRANTWIKRFRPHFDSMMLSSVYRIADSTLMYTLRHIGEVIVTALRIEVPLRRWQRDKIMANPKTFTRGSMIIANDNELVFLPQPHSPRILAAYHERCQQQGLRACA